MKKSMRFVALVLSILLTLGLAAGAGAESDKKVRVALILEGAISDMSWNATAYNGLMKIEALGAEVKYIENTPASSVADAIRTFGDEGYDVIFLATSSFADAGAATAKEYPETQFFFINSSVVDTNCASFVIQDAEQGFLMGALSALLTQSKTVGFIGGLEIQPIKNGGQGFAQGVAYVDPEIKILSQNTGSMDDVNAAKELAKSFIGQGADVLSPMANQASLGVMEAARRAAPARRLAPASTRRPSGPTPRLRPWSRTPPSPMRRPTRPIWPAKSPTSPSRWAPPRASSTSRLLHRSFRRWKAGINEIYAKLAAGEITITLE